MKIAGLKQNENYRQPVIPLLFSYITGILVCSLIPTLKTPAIVISILCTAYILFAILRGKGSALLPLILFGCLGYISISGFFNITVDENHISKYSDKGKYEIRGVISSTPESDNRKHSFTLNVISVRDSNGLKRAYGKLRVTVYGKRYSFSKSDKVCFRSRVRSFRNFGNPGAFDYRRFMAFKGILCSAYTSAEKIIIDEKASPGGIISCFSELRQDFLDKTDSLSFSEDTKSLIKCIIAGEKKEIGQELRNLFNRTGTGHLLAISGLHIGIVAASAYFIMVRVLSFSSFLLWRGWSKKFAALLSFPPALFYGLIAGMPESAQRALIMAFVFILGVVLGFRSIVMNTLAIAALMILIISPPALFSVSFQLSFVAVIAIIAGMGCVEPEKTVENTGKIPHTIFSKTKALFWVSFFATVGTFPVVMYYFNQLTIAGLMTNIIAVPFISFVSVPSGLLSVFTLPFSEYASELLIELCAWSSDILLIIIRTISKIPFTSFTTVTPSIHELIVIYLILASIYAMVRRKKSENVICNESESGFALYKKYVVPLILITFIVTDSVYWIGRRFFNDELIVTIIDVGQGSSALLELPGGKCFMIDGGGFSDYSGFDTGRMITAPFLWKKKIGTVDTIIVSHPESDHINGLPFIIKNFNVRRIWSNNQPADTRGFKKYLNEIHTNGVKDEKFSELTGETEVDGVKFDILYPLTGYEKSHEKWRNYNNNSLVVKVTYGDVSFLFPGDILRQAERELVQTSGEQLKSTVLIAPHHGSNTSSSELFIGSVNPKTAVISAGWKNRYRFPSAKVLARYMNNGISVLRTDLNGAVTMITDGKSIRYMSYRE